MTRTFVVDEADDHQRTIYQTVFNAQQAAMDALTTELDSDELNQY